MATQDDAVAEVMARERERSTHGDRAHRLGGLVERALLETV
jgi:hypothetical protein